MVVCKYFLQGTCKFGNKCKYEHPQGGNAGYAYSAQRQLFGGNRGSYGGGSNFGGGGSNPFRWSSNDYQKQQMAKQSVVPASSNDIVNTVIAEIIDWEKNKMWPFSCVAFEKEAPCIPDFYDTSPEELRLAAYEAQNSGNIVPYVQQVQALTEEFSKKRQMLKQPSMTLKQKLMSLITDYRQKKSNKLMQVSLYSSQSKGNVFGQSSSFGSGGFGETSAFGSQSTFGGSSFGSSSSQSTLNPVSSGTFGTQNSPFSRSGFGASPSTGSSGFGASPSIGSAGFGASPISKTTGFQNTGTSPGLFGAPSTSSGAFGSTAQTEGFVGVANSFGSSAFGSGSAFPSSSFGSSTTQTSSQSFGSNPGATSSGFGGGTSGAVQTDQNSLYTPMDKLTPEELAEFQAPNFTLGRIPTKPPPKELCY